MSLIATITPSKVLNATDPVTYADLNTGFAPTCAISGTVDQPTQTNFAVVRYAEMSLATGATPLTVFAGSTGKTVRMFRVDIMRLTAITAGSAVRFVVRTTAASPTVIAYATIADISSNVVLPQANITYVVGAIGDAMTSGDGIEVVSADVTNAPINGTSGTIVAAISALYED